MDTKKLRQKILDLAIRGKLVPQDPNDEPASVLLERIRAEKERLIKEGKIKRSKKSASDTPHYENIDFDVPSSWEIITLSEVFFMHAGKSISAADISPEPNEEYRYLCVGGNGKRGYVSSYNTVGAHPIIGRQGALCGNVNYTDGQVYATEHAVVVDTFCETEAWWAYYFLKQLNLNQYATATAQPGLSVNTIGDVQIPLPPYKEQVRIVAAIEQWYSLIDALETAKEDLQISIEYTKSKILDLAIHGRLVLQDPNDEPAIELLKRINPKFVPCDNAHYENVAEGWTVCTLEEIIDYEQPQAYIVQSTDYKSQYKIPVLTAGKSFIIGYTNESEGIFTDLPVIIFDDFTTDSKFVDFPFKVKSSAMKILHVKEEVNIQYICWFMSVTRLIGDTHKRYWISEYSKLHIPIPPRKEQDRIINKVNELFQILDNISGEL